ncbi:DUF6150 family protein [Muricauda sp. 334s03]|uniref:DUF6150 family protein n=1 Tax=Flagellimonas yonaguniensis TaxID=3031325 RepID=A0ABT5XX34_9FLAO|nr:DUF6150 family protein [[Muricauda] yonaguniensis]MDF0715663.1 DUF6150 family protein [[Muricauda] yonaguniensis]
MKKWLSPFVLIFISATVRAQQVYEVNQEYKADVKIFRVDQEYKADLLVYVVDREYKAIDNVGLWYFTDFEYKSDFTIYYVNQEYKADLKIFFVDQEYKSTWRNNRKKIELQMILDE